MEKETLPAVILSSRMPTDGGSLEDSCTDMWADVAEATHRRNRNDNVKHNKKPAQQIRSHSPKRRDDPRKQQPGESRIRSLSPRRLHSRSPCDERSKNEQHRKGVVPHRTGRRFESPSCHRQITQNRPPTTIGMSHPGEKHKNASTSRVQRRRKSMGDDDCHMRDHDSTRERYGKQDVNWAKQVVTTFDHKKQQSQPIRREGLVQSCAAPDKLRSEKPVFAPVGRSRRRNSMSNIPTREDRAHEACQEDQVKEKIKPVLDDRKSSGKERNGAMVGPDKKRVDTIELPARPHSSTPPRRRTSLSGSYGSTKNTDERLKPRYTLRSSQYDVSCGVPRNGGGGNLAA